MSDEIKATLARLDERTQKMAVNLDKVTHILLEGNGTPAMTVQVATMDTRLKAMEEDKRDAKIPRHVSVGLVVSIFLGLLGILAGFASS